MIGVHTASGTMPYNLLDSMDYTTPVDRDMAVATARPVLQSSLCEQ